MFESIEIYDGSNSAKFEHWLDDMDQATHITNRNLLRELIKKSGGIITQTLMILRENQATDDEVIAKLRKDFSSILTMNQAWEELRNLVQSANQPVSVYIYKYVHLHFLSSGYRPNQENCPFTIQDFILSLDSKLRRMMSKKYMDERTRPRTLERAFQLIVEMTNKTQEANLLSVTLHHVLQLM